MISFPNAKINIGLFVTERRTDGFHNIESIFYPVNWKDAMEIIPSDKFEFTTSGLPIDGESESNLCVKAYKILNEDFDIPNVRIHLHKVIPMGAGMGGGSADAAFTLKMLNELFELKLTSNQLEEYCRKLGSDCAFFIENEPVFAYNKGDEFKSVALDLNDKKILCVYPNVHISTAEAYDGITPQKAKFDLLNISNLSIENWKDIIVNDFEKEILKNHPILDDIKNQLYKNGALYASMTGSGSTVFGIFDKEFEVEGIFSNFESKWV